LETDEVEHAVQDQDSDAHPGLLAVVGAEPSTIRDHVFVPVKEGLHERTQVVAWTLLAFRDNQDENTYCHSLSWKTRRIRWASNRASRVVFWFAAMDMVCRVLSV
jgi:hypothetical protein